MKREVSASRKQKNLSRLCRELSQAIPEHMPKADSYNLPFHLPWDYSPGRLTGPQSSVHRIAFGLSQGRSLEPTNLTPPEHSHKMNQRTKRRRVSSEEEAPNGLVQDPNVCIDAICHPATKSEKESWNGFCEIESEPVGCCQLRPLTLKSNSVQGSFQCDAPGIRSQGRQSAGSCVA